MEGFSMFIASVVPYIVPNSYYNKFNHLLNQFIEELNTFWLFSIEHYILNNCPSKSSNYDNTTTTTTTTTTIIPLSSQKIETLKQLIDTIETYVQQDDGHRGIHDIILSGELYCSTIKLFNSTPKTIQEFNIKNNFLPTKSSSSHNIVILTGFPCNLEYTPPTETDGPLGAIAIARALLQCGKSVKIVTDECNEEVLLMASAASNLHLLYPAISPREQLVYVHVYDQNITNEDEVMDKVGNNGLNRRSTINESEGHNATIQDLNLSHDKQFVCVPTYSIESFSPDVATNTMELQSMHELAKWCDTVIAIERPGMNKYGQYLTMKGVDISHMVAPLEDIIGYKMNVPGNILEEFQEHGEFKNEYSTTSEVYYNRRDNSDGVDRTKMRNVHVDGDQNTARRYGGSIYDTNNTSNIDSKQVTPRTMALSLTQGTQAIRRDSDSSGSTVYIPSAESSTQHYGVNDDGDYMNIYRKYEKSFSEDSLNMSPLIITSTDIFDSSDVTPPPSSLITRLDTASVHVENQPINMDSTTTRSLLPSPQTIYHSVTNTDTTTITTAALHTVDRTETSSPLFYTSSSSSSNTATAYSSNNHQSNARNDDNIPVISTDFVTQSFISIGIGDGGNEIGMGKVYDAVCRSTRIPHASDIACIIPTTHTIVASVSNWGGYALMYSIALYHICAEIRHLNHQHCDNQDKDDQTCIDVTNEINDDFSLHMIRCHYTQHEFELKLQQYITTITLETNICQAMVNAGARDGVSKNGDSLSVDGISWQDNMKILTSLYDLIVHSIYK